ncbi:MAG TPA: hypothetical protein VE713_03010, partial [Pyrinomonadaceae bacterium]|nr:hypothetical protein [Pyrinomonadaceae bacterium]
SKTIYATLWAARQGPWENGQWQGPGSGLFKSTDGGSTWKQLTKGLPTIEQGLGRIGIAVAPSDPKRLYANVDAQPQFGGVYRSDDAGESWQRVNDEVRVWGRGSDFAEVKVDPRDPDIVYSANTSTYRSTDGGHTYHAWKGAPGGDDYHTVWINPENPEIVLLASDQGATLTVNGGRTWSSWYNQPTAQFYHVSTDNQFPYWVYGGQQESGSIGTTSRGDNGAITFRDWRTVGAEEYGYVAADPLNPNLIYGGKLTRFDKTTGQAQSVAPEAVRSGKYRFLRTAPVLFSPVDPHVLYYAGNVIFKTTNGGNSWEIISPDLTREKYDVPASIGVYSRPEMATMPRRGVIYTVAPSPKDINVIWAGTDDGLIHVTRDGGRAWANVTPPALTSWSKVSIIDAGHFDTQTAYAAVNRFRLDDLRPHIYRTHDGGRTWTEIVNGLPDDPINVVREDPVRRGLLFAGSERAVYVSFDDGDHWQSLRLNMAASSVRDLVIHKDDIVVGTHGRSFWILDDITPLRQLNAEVASSDAFLFAPETAYRVQRNVNTDTPLPPEEPAGQNPPDGAIINYYLKSDSTTPVTLEIYDRAGRLVRRFSSADKPEPVNEKEINVPLYWVRPPRTVSAKAGMQRFVWDLHYPEPKARSHEYPISANYMDTPRYPLGPVVMPGDYTVKLNAAGRTFTRPLTVVIDPRVKTSRPGLEQQFRLSMQTAEGMTESFDALEQLGRLRVQIKDLSARAGLAPAVSEALSTLDKRASVLVVDAGKVHTSLATLLDVLQQADAAPTTQAVVASGDLQQQLRVLLLHWGELKAKDVQAVNNQLRSAGLPPLAAD